MFALAPYRPRHTDHFLASSLQPMFGCSRDLPSMLALLDDELSQVAHANSASNLRSKGAPRTVTPSYRLRSDDDATVVAVELPGVARAHIDVQVKDSTMTLCARRFGLADPASQQPGRFEQPANASGHEKDENDKETSNPNSVATDATKAESPASPPASSLTATPSLIYRLDLRLSSSIDQDRIECQSYRDGVLVLHIPNRAKQTARQIAVS